MEALDDKKHQRFVDLFVLFVGVLLCSYYNRKSIAGSVSLSLTKIMDFFKNQPETTATPPPSSPTTASIHLSSTPRPRSQSPNPARKSMVLFGGSKLVKSNTTDFQIGQKNRKDLFQQQPSSLQQSFDSSSNSNSTTPIPIPQQTTQTTDTTTKPLLIPRRTEHRKSNSCFDYSILYMVSYMYRFV